MGFNGLKIHGSLILASRNLKLLLVKMLDIPNMTGLWMFSDPTFGWLGIRDKYHPIPFGESSFLSLLSPGHVSIWPVSSFHLARTASTFGPKVGCK